MKINTALKLEPKNTSSIKIKINLLISLEKDDELINFVKSSESFEVIKYSVELLANSGKFNEALFLIKEIKVRFPFPELDSYSRGLFNKYLGKDSYTSSKILSDYYLSINNEERDKFNYLVSYLEVMTINFSIIALKSEEDLYSEIEYLVDNNMILPTFEFWKLQYLQRENKYAEFFEYIEELLLQDIKLSYLPRFIKISTYNSIRNGQKNLALKLIEKAIDLDPHNGNYYDSYGEIYLMSNDYEEAIKKFEKAIEINPDDYFIHETYIKMGKCFLKKNNLDLALKYLNKGKEIAGGREEEKWLSKANKLIKEVKKEIKRKDLIIDL